MVARRRELAARYHELLARVPGLRAVRDPGWGRSNFQSFWVELEPRFPLGRDELLAELAAQGISARPGIMAAHRQRAYAGVRHVPLSVTERLTGNTVILPLFHALTEEEQGAVAEALRGAALARTD